MQFANNRKKTKEVLSMVRELCGKCLHSKESHIDENGHLMKCPSCQKLCDLEEFNTTYKPTPIQEIIKIQLAREYSTYTPEEIKK